MTTRKLKWKTKDFKQNNVTRDKEGYFIMKKGDYHKHMKL